MKPKERPILFSGVMVRAILEGTKTQTRRIVKPQSKHAQTLRDDQDARNIACPYGAPSDRLWVRETQWRNGGYVATDTSHYPNEGKVPSIYMRRSACRIVLEVTDVRVERLQEISEEDAIAEGVLYEPARFSSNVSAYRALWDYLNAKRAPWASNPWVWVVEFKHLNGLRA